MTGHKKYIQFSGNMVQSPQFVNLSVPEATPFSDIMFE